MHTHTALLIAATTLIAVAAPTESTAQGRGRGGGGGGGGIRSAPMGGGAYRQSIPRQPAARDGLRGSPIYEPFHGGGTVPYVRNNNWYGHAAPYDARFRLSQPFQYGRFALPGPSHIYTTSRVDAAARRIWLPGGQFEIADFDWATTAPWCWPCDQFVVYPDPDHAGWYLVYDVRMGEYVHAQFLGA